MSGIGMDAAMVKLSTVSLSTIARYAMTAASSLYTLTRREAGNVDYAALATLVARRERFHRSDLVDSIATTNPTFAGRTRSLAVPCWAPACAVLPGSGATLPWSTL